MTNEAISYLEQIKTWCSQHTAEVQHVYPVPELGEGGTCSLFGELSPTPFDLNKALRANELAILNKVQAIVDWVKVHTNVDWFGVYLARQEDSYLHTENNKVLTKLAYFGAPSRAEFPLNEQFSKLSNNVSVGLTGQARVINDVAHHRAEGGEYYTCDPKVKSELCLPIFTPEHYGLQFNENKIFPTASEPQKIVGIIDAECFVTDYFDKDQEDLFIAVSGALSEVITLR